MKGILLLVASTALAQTPEITECSWSQDPVSRVVTIRYVLANTPAIVTLDVLTNGVSIGGENINNLGADINKLVQPGEHTTTWLPAKSWPGHKIEDESAVCEVTAWAKNAPPPYMDVAIATGDVRWFPSESFVPGGVTNMLYKTDHVLLRRIPAANVTWTMGAVVSEPGMDSAAETSQTVRLAEDYYIGVYEITQDQGALLGYSGRSSFACAKGRALENVSYSDVRGNHNDIPYPMPPASDSLCGKLSARSGIAFDLPSESQWEFACRSGTGQFQWNDGSRITSTTNDENLDQLARYIGNSLPADYDKESIPADVAPEYGTAIVGSYAPNLWGLYDMHGNVAEWCIDWFKERYVYPDGDGAVNTVKTSAAITVRGGGWNSSARNCRSAARSFSTTNTKNNTMGLRLCAPCAAENK